MRDWTERRDGGVRAEGECRDHWRNDRRGCRDGSVRDRREGESRHSAAVASIVGTVRTGVHIRISLHERGAALMRSEEAIEKEHKLKDLAVLYQCS